MIDEPKRYWHYTVSLEYMTRTKSGLATGSYTEFVKTLGDDYRLLYCREITAEEFSELEELLE